MRSLVDANVWLPILLGSHPHHTVATSWWDGIASGEAIWCRFTQNAIFRLLTNTQVMAGKPLAPSEAWLVWQRLSFDTRTAFLVGEPTGVDRLWHQNISGRAPTPKLWTDAYLAALAEASKMAMVTFDEGFRAFRLAHLRLLSASSN